MSKKKVDEESAVAGTPVTSEDLKEQGIENYGESIEGNAEKAAEEVEEEEIIEAPEEIEVEGFVDSEESSEEREEDAE